MILSSSAEKAPSMALGLRCVVHRTRQLLPHRGRPESLCTAFQFLSPYLFTCSISMASSSADHGPFFSWNPPPSSPPLDIEDDPPSLFAPTPSMFPTGSIIQNSQKPTTDIPVFPFRLRIRKQLCYVNFARN